MKRPVFEDDNSPNLPVYADEVSGKQNPRDVKPSISLSNIPVPRENIYDSPRKSINMSNLCSGHLKLISRSEA